MISLWKWFVPGLLIGAVLGSHFSQPKHTFVQHIGPTELGSPAARSSTPPSAGLADRTTDREQTRARVAEWAEQDPDAAWDWAFSQPIGDTKDRLLDDLIYKIGTQDPAWAWERSLSLPQSSHRVKLLGHCLKAQAESDPGTAKEWLSSFPPGVAHDQLLSKLLNPIEGTAGGLALVQELATTPFDFKQGHSKVTFSPIGNHSASFYGFNLAETAIDLVTYLGEENPREALTWIGRLGLRNDNAITLIKQWLLHSPEEAQAWIDQAPPEVTRFLPKTFSQL